PAGTGATPKINVTTPGGSDTSTNSFTVTAPPSPPTVTSFTPASGPAGTSVTITGTNFLNASSVKFGGVDTTYVVNSATKITAPVPAGTGSAPNIKVTTPGGTATSVDSFMLTPPPPTITSFTPTSGPVGTSVAITGTNLTGASAVQFGGIDATTYSVDSPTQITATVPAGTVATPKIKVITPGGTDTSTGSFTVTAP